MPAGHNLPVSVPGGADTIVFQVNALRALYQYSNLATSYLFPSTSLVQVADKFLGGLEAKATITYIPPQTHILLRWGSH